MVKSPLFIKYRKKRKKMFFFSSTNIIMHHLSKPRKENYFYLFNYKKAREAEAQSQTNVASHIIPFNDFCRNFLRFSTLLFFTNEKSITEKQVISV